MFDPTFGTPAPEIRVDTAAGVTVAVTVTGDPDQGIAGESIWAASGGTSAARQHNREDLRAEARFAKSETDRPCS